MLVKKDRSKFLTDFTVCIYKQMAERPFLISYYFFIRTHTHAHYLNLLRPACIADLLSVF